MKAIQKIKKSLRTTKKVLRGIFGAYERDRRSAAPATAGGRDSVSEKHLLGGIAFVLRHGILSLYSYIRKFVPWRSRTYIQKLRRVRIAGVASSFLLGLLALAIIIPLYNVSGTEDTEAASSYVPSTSSITFTSTRNKATINLTPTSTTGTFVQSDTTNTSEVASFNVTTDNATGYTLGIVSSTDTTSLTNGTDTLPTITNASSGITAATFNTSTYNDMWGYLPSKYNSASNTGSSAKFYPMTTTTATLDETTAANSTANIYTIALGARVTMSKSSGTYTTPSGTAFVLTAVGKPASYSITYNQNTTDTVSDLPEATGVQSTSAQSITLSSTTPTRTGYDFLGWCTEQTSDQTTESDGSTACSNAGGTYYAVGDTFHIDETTKNVTTLYAIWYLKDITVTGVFGGSGVTGINFANQTYGNESITTNNDTTTLKYGANYTISGTYSDNYKFSSWATTAGGALGSTSSESTTYTVTANSTLTLTGEVATLTLYDAIASMSKGKQTNDANTTTGIQAAITAPTSTDRTQDTSNSGVYEYDASLFGASSDASNDYPIYYYRGILEPTADQGSYGSDGKATTYPNYVKLSNNTCWRILRTTGSGGVKLIYNGTYGATTSGSCANAQSNAQVITSTFNDSSASNGYTSLAYQNIHAVGYTYNNSVTGSTSSTAASTVFGSNSTYSVNSSSSIMKKYLENTWYKNNMTSYTSKLESSAGYCNDRSLYANSSYTTALAESTTVVPYGTSSMTVYRFGAFARNSNSAQKPSLTCPRNVVDLYTTSSASNGNKQLTYPVVLATADEMSFAGSGSSTASNGSSYNAKSFAGSGSVFWLLSPYYRDLYGDAVGYFLSSGGNLSVDYVLSSSGVRPVISLTSGTTPESGSGTATDPWVVTPPPTMQSIAVSDLAEGEEITAIDARDGKDYTIKKINGYLWMTQNLRFTGTSVDTTNSNVKSNKTLTWYSLKDNASSSSAKCYGYGSSGNGYSNACLQDSGSTETGVWYNYYGATAGTVSGTSNSTAASQDICPKNWHLPTGPNTTSGTDYNILVGNTTSGWQAATTGLTAFSAVAGGLYYNGSLSSTGSGHWWSATAVTATNRYNLSYDSSNGQFVGDASINRYYGFFVRCVMTPPTMQSVAVSDLAEGEEVTAIDARDGKDYTIKKINGYLWMTQNLRFTGTSVDTTNSNVTSNKTLTWYSLKDNGASGGKCYGASSSGDGYSSACLQDSGSTETGVWYNYYGATARTVSGTSNSTAASQDICPKNWHLPTGPHTTSGTDFNVLVGNTTSGWQAATTGLAAFSAVAGGYYANGLFRRTSYGYWWSATANSYYAASRYSLFYDSSNGQFYGNDSYFRYLGYFVRCVRTS